MSHCQITVTLGFPTEAARDAVAGYMGGETTRCPFAVECQRRDDRQLVLRFSVPPERLGWAKVLAAEPAVVGGDTGAYELLPDAPDRSAEVDLTPRTEPPCGSSCSKCPQYLGKCGGCPVTPYYRTGHRWE